MNAPTEYAGEATIIKEPDTAARLIAQGWPHRQLASGDYVFPSALRARSTILTRSMKEVLTMQTEVAPTGRGIPNFSEMSALTGGLRGLWIIGGAPGSGKSTLAMNIAANVAAVDFPVLYLDMENDTGPVTREVGDRIVGAYGTDAAALAHLYGFRRLDALEAARASEFPGPALLVIDHLQLLAQGDDGSTRRVSTDDVVRHCQEWVGAGYVVIALSQQSRAAYARRPTLADFKESGGIEAGATAAMHIWQPKAFGPLRVTVVKLRHSPLPRYELAIHREGWRLIEGQRLALPATGGSEQAPRLTQVQRAITKVGEPAKTSDILRELGMLTRRRSTGERNISEAVQRGEIKPVGRGQYALPSFLPSA